MTSLVRDLQSIWKVCIIRSTEGGVSSLESKDSVTVVSALRLGTVVSVDTYALISWVNKGFYSGQPQRFVPGSYHKRCNTSHQITSKNISTHGSLQQTQASQNSKYMINSLKVATKSVT